MELPAEVLVHNGIVGMKGHEATLVRISEEGFYELNCKFGQETYRCLLPIEQTVIISKSPEELIPEQEDIER